jgi:hypothetical protein
MKNPEFEKKVASALKLFLPPPNHQITEFHFRVSVTNRQVLLPSGSCQPFEINLFKE